MFSERLIDDVEKTRERAACNFFKYPARKKKDGSQPTFEEKFKHGAPKNRRWSEISFLTEIRADFAQIQNDILEKFPFVLTIALLKLQKKKPSAMVILFLLDFLIVFQKNILV